MIESHKIELHWNYFLAIESDLDILARYVEFEENNFDCFSVEIARIILTSAAETDVVCKQLCHKISASSTAGKINQYRDEIVPAYSKIPNFEILLPRYGLNLKPWSEWEKSDGVPHWWTAYNKVKHQRDSEYHRANLKNALNAVAGLFVMVLYLYKEKAEWGKLLPDPKILRVSGGNFLGVDLGRESGFVYQL